MSASSPPVLDAAGRQTAEAPSRRPWYRSPLFFVALGVVLAVVAAVLVLTRSQDEPVGAESGTPTPPSSAPYDEAYGTFEPIERAGTGHAEIALPRGATAGIVTAEAAGPGLFDVGFARGTSSMGLITMNGASTPYAGSVPYGLEPGITSRTLQVWSEGPWQVTISPISSADELPAVATGNGDAVFLYDGDAAEWAVELESEQEFVIRQWRVGSSASSLQLALGTGTFEGTVQSLAGPSVVAVHTIGPWSITAK